MSGTAVSLTGLNAGGPMLTSLRTKRFSLAFSFLPVRKLSRWMTVTARRTLTFLNSLTTVLLTLTLVMFTLKGP
jgi:hypothetical protein